MRVVVLVATVLAQAAGFAAPTPGREMACAGHDLSVDSKEIRCRLPAARDRGALRLTVHFSGGHDDTVASMEVDLDGRSITCAAGSKTRLIGEDGDVSLVCLVPAGDATSTGGLLRAVVSWRHAQYAGQDLAPD